MSASQTETRPFALFLLCLPLDLAATNEMHESWEDPGYSCQGNDIQYLQDPKAEKETEKEVREEEREQEGLIKMYRKKGTDKEDS